MKDDIKEIQTIMRELGELRPPQHVDLLQAAIQIHRNRILERALFRLEPSGRNTMYQISNLETIANNQ